MLRARVATGLERLHQTEGVLLQGHRVGLLTHSAAITADFVSAVDVVANLPGVHLTRIFAPEHGLYGLAQDMIPVESSVAGSGIPIISLYQETKNSLCPGQEHFHDIDLLVVDLQDVGSRYYTYVWTMILAMEQAKSMKLPVIVLDRPNPINGMTVEGNKIEGGYYSFIGYRSIPQRHALTIGELARWANRSIGSDLRIVPMTGWRRSYWYDQTTIPWVNPSPNMPTLSTALVYPGLCLVEGTNLSEGRGTTRPFELVGAPFLKESEFAQVLNDLDMPGVRFKAARFQPGFQKWAGQICCGVSIHVTDRNLFQPVRCGIAILWAARRLGKTQFDWRREPYEFESDRLAIDLLWGGPSLRAALERSDDPDQIYSGISSAWPCPDELTDIYLYPR